MPEGMSRGQVQHIYFPVHRASGLSSSRLTSLVLIVPQQTTHDAPVVFLYGTIVLRIDCESRVSSSCGSTCLHHRAHHSQRTLLP